MKFVASAGLSGLIALALYFGAPTSSQAGSNPPVGSIETIVTPTTGGFDWDYRLTLSSGAYIGAIEIPEISAGDLVASLTLPSSWSATEITSPAFDDPILKNGATPGAWILLTSNDASDFVMPGTTVDFTLFSTLGGQAPAQVSASYLDLSDGRYPSALSFTADPSTPTSAPELSTWALMGLGALGLIALRRRKALVAPARA
jgi:MYXO-CTERM domain-containing protein